MGGGVLRWLGGFPLGFDGDLLGVYGMKLTSPLKINGLKNAQKESDGLQVPCSFSY